MMSPEERKETLEDKYKYCPECNKKLEVEETFFGFILQCNDCGLGLGCNERGEINEQNKETWEEWNKQD